MKFLFKLLFLIITTAVFSQNKNVLTNKEYLDLQDKVRFMANSNIDSAFIFADRIQKSNNYTHRAFAAGTKSYLFQMQAKPDTVKSKQYYKLAFEYLAKVAPSKEKTELNANLYNYGGLADWKRNHLDAALNKFQKGMKLAHQNEDAIQYVKLNMNLALVYIAADNYILAISTLKESDKVIEKNESLLQDNMFNYHKSNVNLNLGEAYERYYTVEKFKPELVDSAKYYYEKAINYSKDFKTIKANAEIGLANVFSEKKDLINAEKGYLAALHFSKENSLITQYNSTFYSLGYIYFCMKDYNKSLLYLKKGDSLYVLS